MDQFSLGSAPKASFEDKWNTVPNANKEVLKKSTGKEPIVIMASSKGSNHLVAKGSDSKFYLYTFTQAANPGEPKGPFNSEEDAKKGLTENQIEEGAVIDTALGVAGGLVGLWALINGGAVVLGALGGTALSIADKMKDKAQKAAAKAKKEGRLDTIKPIIAKFENDEELKNMYQALPAKNNFGDNRERNKQMTAIAKYIKSKLNDEEMKYFADISAMLRTGDIA